MVDDERPGWARRIREERAARGWSQSDLAEALRAHARKELPGGESLLRQIKKWEAGNCRPDGFYRPLIAQAFGTVTAAIWPREGGRDTDAELIRGAGMDTLEILTRLRSSSLDDATLEGLRITVDRLCGDYPHLPADRLLLEGRRWLRRITGVLDRRLTLRQHREVLALAGWLAALVGCIEYDAADRPAAEATRRAALELGAESGHPEITAWAHEMRAWFALTRGDYRGVIAAADAGHAAAPVSGAAVQLHAQKAKAWARLGDRRQTELALDQGRTLLERLPHPDDLDHHFAVDPAKWDFYSMDCYRVLGDPHGTGPENNLATTYARNVIRTATDRTGTDRSPMRTAEAHLTLAVVAARTGDLPSALAHGHRALDAPRRSLPSLLTASQDLGALLTSRHPASPDTAAYLTRLSELRSSPPPHDLRPVLEPP